uniref:Uncharacterized protein n=1 Tax=Xenopus tropicalis TaxID=8364 RepID=A0A1B8Y9T8_XENTR
MLPVHNRSALYKVFVPQFTSGLRIHLLGCRTGTHLGETCPLLLRLRAKAPPLHNSSSQDCPLPSGCQLLMPLPLWQHWYYILVERTGVPGTAIYFQLTAHLHDCSRPGLTRIAGPSSTLNMPQSFGTAGGLASMEGLPSPGVSLLASNVSWADAASLLPSCWPIRPTLRNELDTFSVHFYIFFGPNVSVPPDRPAVFSINLLPVLDSGGVLNLEIRLNTSSAQGENLTVFGCLNHGVPLISGDNATISCHTGGGRAVTSVLSCTCALSCLPVSMSVGHTDNVSSSEPTTTCMRPVNAELAGAAGAARITLRHSPMASNCSPPYSCASATSCSFHPSSSLCAATICSRPPSTSSPCSSLHSITPATSPASLSSVSWNMMCCSSATSSAPSCLCG